MGLSLHEVVFELATDPFVPLEHFRVWFGWESIPWDFLWENIPIRINDIPLAHRVLQIT